jgi:hypothetical protein
MIGPGISTLLRLVLLMAVAAPVSAQAMTPTLNWKFGVLLDDKEIGHHSFRVSQDGSRQLLETEAKFDVKILFITAFRYRHQNTEAWEGDCLATIDAQTDSNGKALAVKGQVQGDRFEVSSATGTANLPECVQTFAYWKPEILEADRLLNSQTGDYEDVTVVFEGADVVEVGSESIAASRYRLSAKAGDIKLWYASDDSRWLALEAPAKGGRTIRYEPVAVPDAAAAKLLMARRN